MTEQMRKAIMRIDQESEKENQFARMVAQKVIEAIVDDTSAGAVLKKGKTLKGCTAYITREAKKQAVEDTQAYAWAMEYYGLERAAADKPALRLVEQETGKEREQETAIKAVKEQQEKKAEKALERALTRERAREEITAYLELLTMAKEKYQ